MDFRICILLMFFISVSEGVNPRGLNSLEGSPKTVGVGGKVSGGSTVDSEDPRKAKIMKQINKVNDDGSYTFGYEADDGSFRVETRTKDGVVKGKYGYVDATGQLKVMEYTAGEKTEPTEPESEELSEEKTAAPTAPVPRYLARSTKSAPLPPAALPVPVPSVDQSVAAQTPAKVTEVQYNSEEDSEDDKTEKSDDDDESPKDVNNGQYFRAVQPGADPGASRQSSGQGPKYVPTTQLSGGQYSGSPVGQQQQLRPQQYAGGFGGAGPQAFSTPVLRQQGQQGPSQYSGQPGPSPYSPQGPSPYPGQQGPSPYSSQQGPSPYSGQQGASPYPGQQGPSPYSGQQGASPYAGQQGPFPYSGQQGPSPYSGQQGPSPYSGQRGVSPYSVQQPQYDEGAYEGLSPQQFGRDPNPNVQIQFRGSPNDISSPDKSQQSLFPGGEQQYPGFGVGSGRQFGAGGRQLGGGRQGGQQYVPSVSLDGFSEDADEDGYVDEIPNKGSEGTLAQAQEKQGQAVKVGGGGRSPDAYRPQVLGPQGVLQGGRVEIGERQQPGRGGQNQFLGQGQPQLTEEQLQQLLQQQQPQYQGGQGIPQQYLGQQQFGGFPGQSQGFAPQQQQSQFLGGGRPGQGSPQGQFLGQQNPSIQGQYVPEQGQGQFSGFPQQQFNPQQQEQFRPQGQFLGQGQGLPQGFIQGGQGLSSLSGQGGGSQLSQVGQGSPQQGGQSLQSTGSPFDFNPYGGLPGQGQGLSGQSQGFPGQSQGFPSQGSLGQSQGFPGQFQGFPSQGSLGQSQGFPNQAQGFPGQSQGFLGQTQGFPAQGQGLSQQGGFPGLQGGFPGGAQQGGFAPGRYPGSIQGQQGQIPQQFLTGQGTQLGGGQPRPVQSVGGGVFGSEARKVTSSAPETTTK